MRLITSILVTVSVAGLTLTHSYGAALCLGVGAGAVLFLPGAALGARLGNLHGASGAAKDVNMRLGACLALAGIAAAAQGQEPPLLTVWRIALGTGQGIVSVLGMAIAWREQQKTLL